jgi:hypothetical protein
VGRFRVIDAATGEPVEVEEGEASAGLAQGRYRVGGDAPVGVRMRDGRVADAPPDRVASLLASGQALGLDTPEHAEERRLQREYGNSPVRAGLAGAARGATVGLSDVVGDALGAGDALRELEERNPEASMAGEVGGALAPLLFSGGGAAAVEGAAGATRGGGLLARALRGVTAPARGVARLGEAAEVGVAGLLGRGATTATGRVATRAASLGAAGAVEGAAYGAGDVLSEAALGDHELTGEQLLAGIGWGALTGGAGGALFGGGLGLLGEGARATWAGVRRTGRASRELLERAWSEQTGTTMRPGVAELYERAADTLADAGHLATGESRDFIRRGLSLSPEGQRLRDIIRRGDDVYEDGTRRVVDDLNTAEVANRHAQDFWSYGLKREQIRPAIGDEASVGERAITARTALDRLGAWADGVMADPGAYQRGTLAQARDVRRVVDSRIAQLERAVAEGSDASTDAFMILDATKREVGRLQGSLDQRIRDHVATEQVRDIYQSAFRAPLENPALWGRAAEIQTAVNEVYTRHLTRRSRFVQSVLGDVARDTVDPFRALQQADSARVSSLLRAAGTAANDTRMATTREVLSTGAELSETMARYMDLPANIRREIAEGSQATTRALRTLDEVEEAASALNQFRRLEQQGSVERAIVAGSMGRLVGGRMGDAAASAMASPAQAIRVLSAIEQIRTRVASRTTASVRRYLDRAMETGREVGRRASAAGRKARTRAAEGIGATAAIAEFQEAVRAVAEVQSDPRGAVEQLAARTASMSDDAPRTQAALQAATARAAAFLASKIPPGAVGPAAALPGARRRPRVSDGERERFMRYVRAVENPLSVLDDLERGRLTREGVETLRSVYPRMYTGLQSTVLREIATRAERGRPLPYSDELQLNVLLGVATHSSTRPQTIAMLQQNLAGTETAKGSPLAGAIARRSPRAPELAGSYASETQRIEGRRGG